MGDIEGMTQHSGRRPLIGASQRRVEDEPLLGGRGTFVDDIHLPGTLTLAILRSPYAHARIHAVRLDAARQAPGVVDAIAGDDTAHLSRMAVTPFVPNMHIPPYLPMAVGKVRYAGEEVAAVLATDPYAARDALDLIDVEYEPLPAVTDVEAAVADEAPVLYDEFGTNLTYRHTYGSAQRDVDAALQDADRVVSLRIKNGRVAPMALEPRAVLASFDQESGLLRVWSSTQRPFLIRDSLASLFDLSPEQVHVIAPDVGGGFGGKGPLYREEILAVYLAIKHGRPVRWVATRTEDFLTTMHSRDMVTLVQGGFTNDGQLLGLDVRIFANMGAYLQLSTARPPTRTAQLACGAYRVPVARSEIVAAFTNTVPTGPYRGAGRPEAAFLIERLMDTAARELGIDVIEIRRRNFIKRDEFPWSTPTGLTYDSGDYDQALDAALALADYEGLLERQRQARARGELFGIGLSSFIEPTGGPGWESGRVWVDASGRVTAATGSSAHGQGHETVFAQVVADRLQIPFDQVRVLRSDTAQVPPGIGTFGSRSMALGGSALAQAADAVLEKMRTIAAFHLEVAVDDIVYDDGRFFPTGVPTRAVSFAEVAAAAASPNLPPEIEPGLDVTTRFGPDIETYANGAHIAAVRIDPDTGRISVETYVGVDDAGTLINPLLAEGQLHGGLAQGFGQALMERVVYGENGTMYSGTLLDYSVPRASMLPTFVLGEVTTPSPLNQLGAKGVGEAGTVGAPPALVNAVIDALAPYGVRHLDMPLTEERIWRAIHAARQGSAPARTRET